MMGTTLAGPVPIIVANTAGVPITYGWDIIVKGLHFSPLSLGGAALVLASFAALNFQEARAAPTKAAEEAAEEAERREQQESSRLLQGYLAMPPTVPGEGRGLESERPLLR